MRSTIGNPEEARRNRERLEVARETGQYDKADERINNILGNYSLGAKLPLGLMDDLPELYHPVGSRNYEA